MKPKNLFLAIYEQLTRKGAMRNIFVTRNAFGIFSKNSHVAARSGKPKVAYPSKASALRAAEAMGRKHGVHFSVYKCAWCDGWHVGKNAQNKLPDSRPLPPKAEEEGFNLNRFVVAQDRAFCGYATALREMEAGQKESHWIWYVFPQIAGLGMSRRSQAYAIGSTEEAEAYLKHPVLGERLREITRAVLKNPEGADPACFMGSAIDGKKLQSCMTLFDHVSPNDLFAEVLHRFYNGIPCCATMIRIRR